jgi:hypothetical protein
MSKPRRRRSSYHSSPDLEPLFAWLAVAGLMAALVLLG